MKKANLPFKSEGLTCELCGKDLAEKMSGNVIFVRECDAQGHTTDKIVDVVLVCKECDPAFQDAARKKNLNPTLWNELSHYTNPVIWMSNLIFFLNDVEKGNYSSQAIKKYKNILWETFPYVAREISEDENETARMILSI